MRTAKFGEFLKHRKEFIRIDDTERYKRARVQLHWKGIVLRDEIEGARIKTKEQQPARAGELLVAEIDAKVGGVGIVPPELDGAIVSSHYFLFEIDESKCTRSWLDWFVRSGALADQVAARGSTNYAAIRPHHVGDCELPLPHPDEQRRTVSRIEELAGKVEEARTLRRQAVKETEALLPSSVAQCLARAGNVRLLRETESCEIVCGQHLSPEEQADSGIPYMTGPADFGDRVAVPSRFARFARAVANPGDVLLTVKGAGVGKINLAPAAPTAIGRQLYALRPKPESMDQVFLYYALQDGLRHFREAMTATTVPGIGRSDVEDARIPFPSLCEQRRIAAELDALQVKVGFLKKLQSETAAELDALMPSILAKAFHGEL